MLRLKVEREKEIFFYKRENANKISDDGFIYILFCKLFYIPGVMCMSTYNIFKKSANLTTLFLFILDIN